MSGTEDEAVDECMRGNSARIIICPEFKWWNSLIVLQTTCYGFHIANLITCGWLQDFHVLRVRRNDAHPQVDDTILMIIM